MRIVSDTNVLIAAFIAAEGVCGNLVKRCAQIHTPITSEFILNEFRDKLIRKFKKKQSDVDDAVALLRDKFLVIQSDAETLSGFLKNCRGIDSDGSQWLCIQEPP